MNIANIDREIRPIFWTKFQWNFQERCDVW